MILKILLMILLIPVIILTIALVMNIIPLPEAIDGSRNMIAAVSAGFFSFLYLVWLLVYITYSFRKAGRIFDDLCFKKGLEATSMGFYGRKYSGKINGKKIVIEYFPPRMIQRALLNVFLETRIENGFVISIKRPLLGEVTKRSGPCQEISRIAGYYNIYSENCKKAFKIISDPDIKKAIEPILSSNDHGNSLKQIYFEDQKIWSRERLSMPSTSQLEDHIKNLLILADKLEYQ